MLVGEIFFFFKDKNECEIEVNLQIEAKLAKRVEEAIRIWTAVYSCSEEVDEYKEQNLALPNVQKILIEVSL